MAGLRRAFLDVSPGERRVVVTLDGRPERLRIEREGEPAAARLGAASVARIRAVQPTLRTVFLELPEGVEATAPLRPGLVEGAAVEVEVAAEARRGKRPVLTVIGPAEGPPRLLRPAPDLVGRLAAWAAGTEVETGAVAREAADLAQEAALAVEHVLPGGGSLAVERTRALVAVDVDLGPVRGEAGRALARTNAAAIRESARLLRLKGLGGLVVIDLAGDGRGGEAALAEAGVAFAPDLPGVVFGPVSRLGLLQLAKPWRETPVEDVLLGPDGRADPATQAAALVRELERAGLGDPGALLEAVCAPEVAAVATPLAARLGPRFAVRAEVGRAPDRPDIRRR
jgi:hypothetical protein